MTESLKGRARRHLKWKQKSESLLLPPREPMAARDTSKLALTFYDLSRYSVPHGDEDAAYGAYLVSLGFSRDLAGNYWFSRGNYSERRRMFTAHLDDVGMGGTIHHRLDGTLLDNEQRGIVAADDKAGVALILYMIHHGVPGTYALFVGEECGRIGSEAAARLTRLGDYDFCVSFDRKGYRDIITHQMGKRCCSDAFAEALAKQLNQQPHFEYAADPTGSYTDSASFTRAVPECTNLSVGYFGQHTDAEYLDLEHLDALGQALLNVNWGSLPIERDTTKVEYRTFTRTYELTGDEWWLKKADPLPLPAPTTLTSASSLPLTEVAIQVYQGEMTAKEFRSWAFSNSDDLADVVYDLLCSASVDLDMLLFPSGSSQAEEWGN